jgi:hypothetical protein
VQGRKYLQPILQVRRISIVLCRLSKAFLLIAVLSPCSEVVNAFKNLRQSNQILNKGQLLNKEDRQRMNKGSSQEQYSENSGHQGRKARNKDLKSPVVGMGKDRIKMRNGAGNARPCRH